MRQCRLKIPPSDAAAAYHCITRTVNGERLLGVSAREVLRRQLWQVAEFCGVHVLTYAILSNHFHVLVLVPKWAPVSDEELIRRYRILHARATPYQAAQIDIIADHLRRRTSEGAIWRCRQLALMGDVSQFMKLLKQRFSIWFNQTHGRFGTLWAERFKSVLVEPLSQILRTVAAYIDLNPVRAGLAADPKDYRFCGYADAVGGNSDARVGLTMITGEPAWSAAQAAYRQLIFGIGARARSGAGSISMPEFQRVMRAGGELSLAEALRCRWRYFSEGMILGSRAFVANQMGVFRPWLGFAPERSPLPVPAREVWGELFVLRDRGWRSAT